MLIRAECPVNIFGYYAKQNPMNLRK